ncbi:MAG: magnesium transporter [Candidatus Rokubacteria bacterium]|nr:magnesium transporter [Candidatus Rokubacteria bacterium]
MGTLANLVRAGDLAGLQRWLVAAGTLEVAEELVRLPPADRGVPFRLLSKDRALAVFEALDPVHQHEVLAALREGTARELFEQLDADDRARLLDEMPATLAQRLLTGLSPHERQLTATVLGYPEQSAGRIMLPEYAALRPAMTIAQAIAGIRTVAPPAETLAALPVTDDERRLVGVVALASLVLAPEDGRVADVMSPEVHRVRVDTDQEIAARLMQEADLLVLPVLDLEDRLVGVITVDDAMEVLEAEATEDQLRTGGAEPLRRPYLSVSVLGLARSRAIWLLALIVAAILTVNVLQFFEEALETVVTLALFIPLLIDTGGNAGAQSATTVVRAMAVGELRFGDLARVIARETGTGFLLGLMLGTLASVPVAVFFGPHLAAVVSLSLLTVCTLASVAGALLPMVATRVGVDPAVVSAPLVTTLVDATGLVVYFVLARAILIV